MEWIIEIDGDSLDLDELSKVFTCKTLSIQKKGEQYFIKSDQFDKNTSYNEVKVKATEYLAMLSVGCMLSLDARKKIEIKGISYIGDEGKTYSCLEGTITISSRMMATIVTLHPDDAEEISNPADPILRYLKLAKLDPKVARVFELINEDFSSWGGLFKFSDILWKDCFKPIRKGGHSFQKNKDFRETANPHRHGDMTPRPPKMTLLEAKFFIKRLLLEWLMEKEQQYGLA